MQLKTTDSRSHPNSTYRNPPTFFHCTTDYYGHRDVLNTGGKYEKIDESGRPVRRKFGGYAISQTPQVCFSKSISGCLFAVIKNKSKYPQSDPLSPLTLHVYRTNKQPDIDLSTAIADDFSLLDEVRYNEPSERPVAIVLDRIVDVPPKLQKDVVEAYNPHGPFNGPPERELPHPQESNPFDRVWADRVKDKLEVYLRTGNYTSPDVPTEQLYHTGE